MADETIPTERVTAAATAETVVHVGETGVSGRYGPGRYSPPDAPAAPAAAAPAASDAPPKKALEADSRSNGLIYFSISAEDYPAVKQALSALFEIVECGHVEAPQEVN